MTNQSNNQYFALQELYGRVDEVLFYEWDPIGVNGMPSCRDEYDNYLPIITSYLESHTDSKALHNLMLHIVVQTMGLNAETGSARMRGIGKSVGLLWAWKRHLSRQYAMPHWSTQATPFKLPLDDQLQWSKDRRREMVLVPDHCNILGLRVGEVLRYQWNPLKVPRHPICRDVYSAYLPEILAALESSASPVQLEALIEEAELDFPRDQSAKTLPKWTAELILEWKKLLS